MEARVPFLCRHCFRPPGQKGERNCWRWEPGCSPLWCYPSHFTQRELSEKGPSIWWTFHSSYVLLSMLSKTKHDFKSLPHPKIEEGNTLNFTCSIGGLYLFIMLKELLLFSLYFNKPWWGCTRWYMCNFFSCFPSILFSIHDIVSIYGNPTFDNKLSVIYI